MNEQELADLFSAQIDRVLGGESAIDLAVESDLPLLALGQQLSQVNFQASPTAQTAFQSQLAGWFGSTNGLSAAVFGSSKSLLLSLGVALVVMSAGLALVVLLSFIWAGALFTPADNNQPGPTIAPTFLPGRPVLASPEASPTPVSTPTRPRGTSSLGDVLPTATTAIGDTILLPTITPTATEVEVTTTGTPATNPTGEGDSTDNSDTSTDTTPAGDHDRGHGNDPDGYDQDNPGQSDGVSGGNDSNSPGDLTGGSGGGSNTGGSGNSGNNDSSNGGNNGGGQGGNGGNSGGGKRNN